MQTSTLSSVALETGIVALQQQHYTMAIGLLEAFCHDCVVDAQLNSRDYLRAQMHLIQVYEQQGSLDRAITLCNNLLNCPNAQVQIWANQKLTFLTQLKTNLGADLGADLGVDLGVERDQDGATHPDAVTSDPSERSNSPLSRLKRLFHSAG